MNEFIQFAVIGVAIGAVYALLAQGLVLIHRASGVVNFSQAAFAVVAGFTFAALTQSSGWGAWTAFGFLTAMGSIAGVVVYVVAIRPFRDVSQLTRIAATLAVLLIAQALATLKWGATSVLVTPYLSSRLVELGGVVISVGQITLAVIACVLTVVLWAGMRFTLPGIAIRGVAESRRATAALGWSPELLAAGSWALAGALGAAAGVLIAPLTAVQVNQMTLLLVPALAAALFGRFSSFPMTLAGAMGIGIAQAEASNYVHIQGASDALPLLAIVIVLMARGQGIPMRGQVAEQSGKLGTGWISPRIVIPCVVVVAALMLTTFSPSLNDALTASIAFAIVLLSVVVMTGYCGQLSLAQLCFSGLAALVAGRLVAFSGVPFVLAALIGVVVTVPIGLAFAIPALRTRGTTLAILTLAMGSAVTQVVFNNADIIGGVNGTAVGPQTVFGIPIDSVNHSGRYGVVALLLFGACAVMVANVRRSRVGRRLLAVRANERGAAALGINVYSAKLYAFGLSSAIAAVGGIMIGFQFETIVYTSFDPFQSILVTGYAVIGGVGYVSGAVHGAAFAPGGAGAWILQGFGADVERYVPLIGGVGLLLMLLQNPNGLAFGGARLADAIRARARSGRGRATITASMPDATIEKVRPALLEVRDLVVRFGGVTAVDNVSLTLRPGRISGLIGPNGAGKTTVIDAITGFVRPSKGTVTLDGKRIEKWSVHRRARAGVSRSFQSLELFEGITVRENLLAACEPRDASAYATSLAWSGRGELSAAACSAIREFQLEEYLDRHPSELPYGARRLVAIARAMACEPSTLLLDEPAAGLDEQEAAEIARLVRGLATRWGISILLIEHDVDFVMKVCDDITVLDFGCQIAHGTPDEVRRDPRVIPAYLGTTDVEVEEHVGATAGSPDDVGDVVVRERREG